MSERSATDPWRRMAQLAWAPWAAPGGTTQDLSGVMADSMRFWVEMNRLAWQTLVAPYPFLTRAPVFGGVDREQELATLAERYTDCRAAFERKDAEAAASFCTTDVRMWMEFMPPVQGRQALAAAYRELFASPAISVRYGSDDRVLSPSGDSAWETGWITAMHAPAPEADPPFPGVDWRGRYLAIWKKADGEWLMNLDMTNSQQFPAHSPPPMFAAPGG